MGKIALMLTHRTVFESKKNSKILATYRGKLMVEQDSPARAKLKFEQFLVKALETHPEARSRSLIQTIEGNRLKKIRKDSLDERILVNAAASAINSLAPEARLEKREMLEICLANFLEGSADLNYRSQVVLQLALVIGAGLAVGSAIMLASTFTVVMLLLTVLGIGFLLWGLRYSQLLLKAKVAESYLAVLCRKILNRIEP